MKKVCQYLFVILLMMTISPLAAYCDDDDDSETITVTGEPFYWPDYDPEGNRAPARPLICVIDKRGGVSIQGFNGRILSYEIWDDQEECVATFQEEASFLAYLFSLQGDYRVRFITDTSVFSGYISL